MSRPPAPPVRRVLVHEFLAAGGHVPGLSPAEHADLLAQGRAMRDAMLQDLAALPGVQALADDGSPDAAATLADAARRGWQVWAVAPESGGLLEALARAVPPTHWLGCDAGTIALTASKRATTAHLAAHGIAVPAEAGATAWVVKPDDGAGAAETRRHASRAAAEADACTRTGACVVEPWVPGDALSLSLVCSARGAELLAINRQHIEVDATGGVHFRGVSPAAVDPASAQGRALAPLAAAVARALPGLRGYVGIDLVWTPEARPVVIEVNPRLTTAYVGLSARLGRNVAAQVLAAF